MKQAHLKDFGIPVFKFKYPEGGVKDKSKQVRLVDTSDKGE